jgi:6-pyruvoyltetrahydropterin/6-carboxytetrahydropterin synthase
LRTIFLLVITCTIITGRCENPHGHNYRVCITLVGEELQENGILLDFKQIKMMIKPVVDGLDHQMINDIPLFTDLNPSAENLALYFFDEIDGRVVKTTANRIAVKRCTIYETDRSSATYSR